jgi:hypothetical protein
VAVLGLLSVERLKSPVEIESAGVALVVGQAFFLVVVWPWFERRASAPGARSLADAVARLVGLLVLSVPFFLIARHVATFPLADFARSQAVVFGVGCAVLLAVRLPGWETWYFPAAFGLSAVLPFAAYLLHEEAGYSSAWASSLSPLWASGRAAAGGPILGSLVALGAITAVELVVLACRPARGE